MNFTDTEIALFIQQYFFPFARIAMMFMVMPVIGSRIVSARIRLVLALLVTLVVVPILPTFNASSSLSLLSFLFIVQELAIGAIIGFSFQIVFQVYVLSGQFMAMKMGLGFASMNDPTNGVQTTVLSQFFLMLVTLTFILINGHLVLISLLVESFRSFPVGDFAIEREMFMQVVQLGGWMFATALVFALPVLTSLLIVNIAFGVMSRTAPQLNIFAVGFPFTLVCGLILIWIGLANFTESFENTSNYGFQFLHELLKIK